MEEELYFDFCSASYNKIKRAFLVFLCLDAAAIAVNLLGGNYDIIVGFGPFMSFIMALVYFRTNKAVKIGYERIMLSRNAPDALTYELYDEKIVSRFEQQQKPYYYDQISGLFETKNFLLLHLKYNLYVTLEKSSLSASVDEIKPFLIKKCTNAKRKRFINCSNDKKWALALLIAQIVVCIAGSVIGIILKSNI